jgi:F-type H+-transporting ATPase subunit b
MPQIAQIIETYASQVFWLLIVFGLIYFGIGRGMLPKIEATVDARDRKIADDLAAAETARAEADNTEAAWRAQMNDAKTDAQVAMAKAKSDASEASAARVAAADAKIGETLAAAEAKLAIAKSEAMASVETIASEAAQDIVAKLSGSKITPAAATKAVKAALANV